MRVDCAQKGIANPRFKASGLQIRWNGGLDVAMGLVGLCGPIGFGISMAYFVTDLTTDSFNGWGKIQY